MAGTGSARGHHNVNLHIRMRLGQGLKALGVIHVLRAAHAKVEVNGVFHTGGQCAAHDGQHRRQPRATAHAQHGAGVFLPQISRAQRAADAQGRAHLKLLKDVFGNATVGHAANLELHLSVIAQTGHGVGANVFGRELQAEVLTGAERDRLGQLDANAADVVRGLFNGRDRGFDDARRVHHHFVGLGQLNHAVTHEHRLAGQHVVVFCGVWPTELGAAAAHLPRDHAAAAGAAAPGHAAVRHRQLVRAQHVQQIASAFHAQAQVHGLNDEFHFAVG